LQIFTVADERRRKPVTANGQKTQTTSGQSKIGSRHEEQEVVGAPG
jgi:hypothetical protein